ncbi:hypothetical protein M378DRAFT_169691 [Amanita muscaria Koide BX008]|uniref:Uncharacterized protein n=1 Tax=Amanita muscaria (strain Koide BX008) TaxID=946122 RepID=A0A0C2S8Q7_AMAMK|nr:hypothetical protein M378DRAFT_169691 [Amanita muscaria Koide BX008]
MLAISSATNEKRRPYLEMNNSNRAPKWESPHFATKSWLTALQLSVFKRKTKSVPPRLDVLLPDEPGNDIFIN